MTRVATPEHDTVLQPRCRLSESVIWTLQREFYEAQGPAAWKPKGIPFWMTSNRHFARAMARVVLGFLRDAAAAGTLDPEAPVNVLELAAGSGQFGFTFLSSLRELRQAVPGLASFRVRYVMTDLARSNVAAWRAHPRLRPFVEEGLLDFACFDLEQDADARLLESGETLASANPLVVLANYAFDSTRQDCFRVQGRTLAQDLVTATVVGGGAADVSDPTLLERIRLRFDALPMPAAYYEDALSNRVLEGYRQGLGDTTFLFPVGAIGCVRRLLGLSGGRMFLLCGDKGAAHEEQLRGRGDPIMTLHGSCFSFIVNLNAIGHYFEEGGGVALHASQAATGFQVSGFLAGFGGADLAETRHAFGAEIDHFGPVPFFTLVKSLMRDMPAPSLDVLLAVLELSEWDAEVVYAYCDPLRAHARGGRRAPAAGAARPRGRLGWLLPAAQGPRLRAGAHLRRPLRARGRAAVLRGVAAAVRAEPRHAAGAGLLPHAARRSRRGTARRRAGPGPQARFRARARPA